MDARQKVIDNIDLIAPRIDEVLAYLQEDASDMSQDDSTYFYNLYHDLTGKNKTDKKAVAREWKKMTKKERKKAVEHVYLWAEYHFDRQTEKNYIKKCYTYLRDKNYEDELVLEQNTPKHEIKDFNDGPKSFR